MPMPCLCPHHLLSLHPPCLMCTFSPHTLMSCPMAILVSPASLSPSLAVPMLPSLLCHNPMSLVPCQTSPCLFLFITVPCPLCLSRCLSSIIPPTQSYF